jgi:hypothetical protein
MATRLLRPSPTRSWAARPRSSRPAPAQTRTLHPRVLLVPWHPRTPAAPRARTAGYVSSATATGSRGAGSPRSSAASASLRRARRPQSASFEEKARLSAPVEDPEKEDGAALTPTPTLSAVLRVAEPEAKLVPVPMTPGGGLVRKFRSLLVGGHGSVCGRVNKRSSILGGLSLCPSADVERPAPISASSTMRSRTTWSRRVRTCLRRRRSSRTRRRRHRART